MATSSSMQRLGCLGGRRPRLLRKAIATHLAALLTIQMVALPVTPFARLDVAPRVVADEATPNQLESVALDDAIFRFNGGDYVGSIEVLSSLLRTTTNREVRLRAKLYEGLNYIMLGETTRANRAFLEVLDIDPDYRLDPSQFAPNLVEAFERARRLLGEEALSTVVSYHEPAIRYAPEAEIPEQLAGLPWYKKWWVWGLVGVVIIGGALAATGGHTTTYAPPVVQTSFPVPPSDIGICLGQSIELEATITGGEAPFTLTWDEVQFYGTADEIRKTSGVDTVSDRGAYRHRYTPTYQPKDKFDYREFTLEVLVSDKRNNEGALVRHAQKLMVNNCF